MVRFRKYAALMFPVVLMLLLNSCVAHHMVNRPPDEALKTAEEVVLIHWGVHRFELQQPQVRDEILEGSLFYLGRYSVMDQPERTSQEKVIAYVSPTFALVPADEPQAQSMAAIPLAEITKVQVQEVNEGVTFIRTVGALALVAGVAFVIVLATKDSCPFIYVEDDEGFHLVGEIYSGAIHPPLERHDYLPLPVSGDGNCNLKITNEVLEIQHTNLTELLVFDHAPGERVLVDRHGVARRVAHPVAAEVAESLTGADIRSLVAADDGILFLDGTEGAAANETAMDGMVLSFARPEYARNLKLIVNARNTTWLDHVMGVLFERMGDMFKPWQEAQKSGSAESMGQWSLDQGLPLKVSLKTAAGWRYVDHIDLPGPIAPRDAVIALDLDGIVGDQVTVKLECGYRFWEIDSVLADFSPDDPVHMTRVPLQRAVTKDGEDVAADLRGDDDLYLHQPVPGDEAILRFELPDLAAGLGRSVILHSKGHYDILREPQGQPDHAFVASFRNPGRVAEYSRDLYLSHSGSAGD